MPASKIGPISILRGDEVVMTDWHHCGEDEVLLSSAVPANRPLTNPPDGRSADRVCHSHVEAVAALNRGLFAGVLEDVPDPPSSCHHDGVGDAPPTGRRPTSGRAAVHPPPAEPHRRANRNPATSGRRARPPGRVTFIRPPPRGPLVSRPAPSRHSRGARHAAECRRSLCAGEPTGTVDACVARSENMPPAATATGVTPWSRWR